MEPIESKLNRCVLQAYHESKEGSTPRVGLYFPALPRCVHDFFFPETSAADYVFETGSLELLLGISKFLFFLTPLVGFLSFFLFGGEYKQAF